MSNIKFDIEISNSLNISIETIEKVMNFFGIEQLAGIGADVFRYWRLKNTINLLIKTKKFLEENGYKSSSIDFKYLFPILEKASLEENETLQQKWAKLLYFAMR